MTAVPATAPRHARWDGRRVLFEVRHDGAELPCAISPDALRDLSASRCFKPADLLRVFAAHRIPVEAMVLNKLRRRRSAMQGPLMLWSGDIEEFGPAAPAVADPPALA
ncbi:DUF1488 family protein [Falsiroseomonas sp. HW251]|uniref:DUF1488 family protein n=1 Tax=Falsiroseomonas sp. HW251 TaxID=3390998 RepID=UPI003D315C7B